MSGDKTIVIRPYQHDRDFSDIRRIWEEAGWMECENEEAMALLLGKARTTVGEVNGHAESMVSTLSGELLHGDSTLDLSVVGAVLTGFVSRKLKLARKITALRLAEEAGRGAHISTLGMFEQGFYNTLGFGSAGYLHIVTFQPASLRKLPPYGTPVRLTVEDVADIHENRRRHLPSHGRVLLPKFHTHAELLWKKTGFGLGFKDTQGRLTHHLWLTGKGKEQGPFKVEWMAYETKEQLIELLSLLRSMGDQIHSVTLLEPPHVQIQDFLERPFYHRSITRNSPHQATMKAISVFQIRILNLEETLKRTHLTCPGFDFNLELTDPVKSFLPEDSDWRGCSGQYQVHLGKNCRADKGKTDPSLPTLVCSVNAFSRMWLGVRPASVLQVSESLEGDPSLISRLDHAFNLPTPHFNWEF